MRLLPTISRLFADYSATALRLFRACAGSRAGICVQFRRGRAACLGGRSGSRNAGRRWLGGQQAAPRICEHGRERGRPYQGGAGECLYLRRNCPLNARLRFRSILIYPQYKHAVYARFRGCFAAVQKIAPENAGALHRAGGREKPRQASSLSGRVFIWSFSPRQ
nr:MAG TPA: hypothetical protein [Caudoviricetes sp.]